MQQIFESDRIRFTEVSELLIPDYLTLVNDWENVQRFIGRPHDPYTAEQEREWVRRKLAEKAPVFSLIEKETGAFIGNIELMGMNETEGELGIALTAAMQDRGFGTEAVTALVWYGFDVLDLQRIFLRTRPFNARALRTYQKCGFREYMRTEVHIHMEITRETAGLDVPRFSEAYTVRRLGEADVEDVYALCSGNPLYYRYCPPFVTRESIREDMRALPPGKELSDKYFVGYYDRGGLTAVLDLIAGYPDGQTAFIGFFMMNAAAQGRGTGSRIVQELCGYLRAAGFSRVRLAWVKGNPQAEHFWRKNGFAETGIESERENYTVIVAEKDLRGKSMITIKETAMEDLPNVQRLWADGDVMKFVGFPDGLQETDEAMREWLGRVIAKRPAVNHYSIYEDGVYCGETNYSIDADHASASLDIKLFRFARGRGIATQALSFAREQAFRNGAERVWVDPAPENVKAIALYERLGFQRKEMPAHVIALGEDWAASIYMESCRE